MNSLKTTALQPSPETIYSVIIGCAILLVLSYNLTMCALSALSSSVFHAHVRSFFLNHLVYARSYYRFLGPRSISRPHFTLASLYYVITGIFNYIGIHNVEAAGKRAARISLVNLVPLFLGGGYEFGARLLGMSLESYGFLHFLLASVAFLEATVHVIILAQTKMISLEDNIQFHGILAASMLLALFLLPFVKKRVYEVFHITHVACAVTLVYAIWQHCRLTKGENWAFALTYTTVFALTGVLQLMRIIYRNRVFGRSHVRLNVQPYIGDVALITLTLPKPWTVRAGQRINLGIPRVGITYVLQTHPFAISWWETDVKGRAVSISVLLRPRSGFTRRLFDNIKVINGCGAWIDGPFGPSSVGWKLNGKVGDYGHVFMAITGIGIAAQLPYIKELLDGHDRAEIPTQRISLVWQLDQAGDWESTRDILQMLVRQDNGYMLRVSVYDTTQSQTRTETQHIGDKGLITVRGGQVDWEEQLNHEMKDHAGQLLVSVSAQDEVRNRIRNLVRLRVNRGVELFETEFQPWRDVGGLRAFLNP